MGTGDTPVRKESPDESPSDTPPDSPGHPETPVAAVGTPVSEHRSTLLVPLAILLTWCAKMWSFLTWKLVTMYISSIWVLIPRLLLAASMASIPPSHITSSLK